MRRKSKSFCQVEHLELRQLLSTIYVSAAASGPTQDGASWATAFTNLQSALAVAGDGTTIEVGQGTYYPATAANPGDRSAMFELSHDITIQGGYAGTGQPNPDARNVSLYPTILSGDIGKAGDNSDNSYHVIVAVSPGILDGLTITGGNADVAGDATGGGIFAASYGEGLTIRNSTIIANNASYAGGGIYNMGAELSLDDCAIIGNSAHTGGGIADEGGLTLLTNCSFTDNLSTAPYDGGAALTGAGSIVNCIFWANSDTENDDEITGGPWNITYSDVDGGYAGAGNINSDPGFVRTPSPGSDGVWGTSDDDDGDLSLQPGSPAINTGSNAGIAAGVTTDLAGDPRIVNGIMDMGAYESQAAQPIYVDASATGGLNNGISWINAFTNLQSALNAVTAGAVIDVAAGDYSPGADGADTFQLQSGVTLQGGFAVGGSTSADPSANITTLDGGGVNYHVVTGSGTDSTAVLDGFTITGGNANLAGTNTNGAGIFDSGASPTIIDCTITGNISEAGNAYSAGGGGGGGMFNLNSSPTLIACTITGNSTGWAGGGIYDIDSSPTLTNCVITGNSARYGGGINNFGSSPTLINCTLSGNTASRAGGAMDNYQSSYPTLVNSIVWGNSVGSNENEFYDGRNSAATITYSDIEDGFAGMENIDANPMFVSNLQLGAGSPAINAGSNAVLLSDISTDVAGSPRVAGGIVDMGAYEYQAIEPIYVDEHATGLGNGTSWANAFTDLQPVLTSIEGSAVIEVAQGTYYPTAGMDGNATFQLIDGVAIYGGYAGDTTSDPGLRNVSEYPTILSGDINPQGNGHKSYHLVSGSYTDSTAMLDGFTVTDGQMGMYNDDGSPTVANCTFTYNSRGIANDGSSPTLTNCTITQNGNAGYDSSGAGMNNWNSSPILTNCVISGNISGGNGAGIYNYENSDPILNDCTIDGNLAFGEGGGIDNKYSSPILTDCTISGNAASIGGGIENYDYASPTLTNCTISGNTASGKFDIYGRSQNTGGGIDNSGSYSSPILTACTISGNFAESQGGGMYSGGYGSAPELINCLITSNSASNGGGIVNTGYSLTTLINSTFSQNAATGIAAVHEGGAIDVTGGRVTLTNCILWGDSATNGPELHRAGAGAIVTYSDIEGGFAGTGNINANPQFVDAATGNFQLQSASPAIDAGSNAGVPASVLTDRAGNGRFVDTLGHGQIVDMGAYEYSVQVTVVSATLTPSQLAVVFSANVSASINLSDLQLTPLGSSSEISPAGVTYDPATQTADFDLSNLPGGIYSAFISPTSISDPSGNILAGGFNLDFLLVGANQQASLPGSDQTYTVQAWAFGSDSSLDIGSDTLIVTYTSGNDPAGKLAVLLGTGYADGQWNGNGIISSATLGEPANTTAVGSYDNGSSITIRRTWIGDANLDGQINSDDLSLMMLGQAQGQTRWQDGNFNYDTQINADDWIKFMYVNAYSNGQMLPGAQNDTAIASSHTASISTAAFAQTPLASADDLSDLLSTPAAD